jgi:hypothetical protein
MQGCAVQDDIVKGMMADGGIDLALRALQVSQKKKHCISEQACVKERAHKEGLYKK